MKKPGILSLALLLFLFFSCNGSSITPNDEPENGDLPAPPPAGPVTHLTLHALDTTSGEHGPVEEFVENDRLMEGSELFPYWIGSIGRGFTANVSVEVFPRNAANPRVVWVGHNTNIAVIDRELTTDNIAVVRGLSNGTALFHVESAENPEILVYFSVRVTDPVYPIGFIDPAFEEFPLWDDPLLNEPNGLYHSDYKTLGLGRIGNADMSSGIFTVRMLYSYSE